MTSGTLTTSARPTTARSGRHPVRDLAIRAFLAPVSRVLHLVGPKFGFFMWLIVHTPPRALAAVGRWRAENAANHASKRVPAYREHVESASREMVTIGSLRVPSIDKHSYIDSYPIEARCLGGRMPSHHVTIDESSGSSGTPYNWVRSDDERFATHVFISHFARYLYGAEPIIAINAFSMGAWATGMNMAAALERTMVVKSTGPDMDKIFKTLEFLGSERRYLICGYPPFLKLLIDTARERGFPLAHYRLMGMVGGEGMSEGLRDYLGQAFQSVYSGYGATDVEIGIAGETPFSVAVRRLADADPELRHRLFGSDARLPMVFHYNPLQHHVTVNESGELIFTINRLEVVAPRIGYNIHDVGGVATYADVCATLHEAGIDAESLWGGLEPIPLPLLWVHGRSDYTVSVMGANIYPEDIETALYRHPELSAVTNSFSLGVEENGDGSIRPVFSFELGDGADGQVREVFADLIVATVVDINADLRTAAAEDWDSVRPIVRLYDLGEGPFAADSTKIKQTRMVR